MLLNLVYGFAFVGSTVTVILAAWLLTRRLAGEPEPRTAELASSVVFRISALHGLILALAFAQEGAEYQRLKTESYKEASAIADIYNDARRYSPQAAEAIRPALDDYVRTIVEVEWTRTGLAATLSATAWAHWESVYELVLDLDPQTPRQAALREHMLDRIHLIAETRDLRLSHRNNAVLSVFWFAALSGVVLVAMVYYPFPPRRQNVVLLCLFGTYTGIILFLIYALSNPFGAPGAIPPPAFSALQDVGIGASPPQN